ncbi:MAG: hypothetical protein AAGA93_01420 [Actinomycetota bacterium]
MLELTESVSRLQSGPVAIGTERDLLIVAGPDAASYLQGQLSQDVDGLAVGATSRSLLLQPQGKVDSWLRVHRRADDTFWLDTDVGHGAAAEARLNRFKLRVDCTIEVRTVPVLAIRGPGSGAVDPGPAGDDVVALDATWGGIDGIDLLAPAGGLDADAAAAALGLDVAPGGLGELVRIEQGLPAMGHELDESTIPAAAGIVEESVDFTKGCYVGQELVARVDSRGNNTPTRLHRLRFPDGIPDPGSELLADDGKAAGTVTSAVAVPGAAGVGLGYLKRSVTAPVTLTASVGDREVPVEATALD